VAVALCAGAALTLAAPLSPAAATPAIVLHATLNTRDVTTISQGHPLRLPPDQTVIVTIDVTNNTARDLQIRSVNLNGRVMGLTFFSFETRIDLTVAAGTTEHRTFAVELVGLKGQATGLLPGRLDLLDPHRHVIISEAFAADVRGSLRSVYGVFGVLVALITALLLISGLVRLAAGRLSANRWSRGVRFGTAGIGLGLTLTFSLSAFRVLLPNPADWVTILLTSTLILFLIGYVTPTPSIYDQPDDEDDDDQNNTYAATTTQP
jgi:hypothetical protein